MGYTRAEETYLKTIYKLSSNNINDVSTNELADELDTKASSVTDMMQKLSSKDLLVYKKYKGVKLTDLGKKVAINIVRKHRLWEFFLVEKLNFKWDEVHELAEQLEHIKSDKLTNSLDEFLDFPKFDPHGDPIPDKDGNLPKMEETYLVSELEVGMKGVIVGVNHSEKEFLQYLEELNLNLGVEIQVSRAFAFDRSKIILANGNDFTLSHEASKKILVKKI